MPGNALRSARLAATGAIVAGVLAACSTATAADHPAIPRPRASQLAAGSPEPYQLYTHCGIDQARIGNRYFEAVHPLSDGAGNPPAGWANPYQQGTMTLLSPTRAVFRDRSGHRVVFRLRPGATSFPYACS
jgi:hypothetical protein